MVIRAVFFPCVELISSRVRSIFSIMLLRPRILCVFCGYIFTVCRAVMYRFCGSPDLQTFVASSSGLISLRFLDTLFPFLDVSRSQTSSQISLL